MPSRYTVALLLLGGMLYVYGDSARGGRKMMQEGGGGGGGGGSSDPGHVLRNLGISMTTAVGGMRVHEYCNRADAAALAARFRNLTNTVPFWTACGANEWMDKYQALSPKGPKTFIDIGCNKGYTSAKMFGLWAPETGFKPTTLQKRRPEVLCGTCGDCEESVTSTVDQSGGGLTVFCVEPSLHNFANLVLTREKFFVKNKQSVQWYVVNAAMSNDTGLVQFPRDCVDELCSLDGQSDGAKPKNHDYVALMTVDYFLKKYGIPAVDILKIDTEGFDATVIMGAMESIAKGLVGVISFEYHEVGVWREYSLHDIVEKLEGMDYVCYFDGKPSLARMTGCWDDAYEMYSWSNVVCVPRRHVMYPEMEKMTLRYEQHRDAYYQGAGAANSARSESQDDAVPEEED